MRILFIGDNLVRGSIGVNWVKWLAGKNPAWEVENAGVNGETLVKIKQRLDKKLKETHYDMIFFQAGISDLLIPAMKEKGFLFRQAKNLLMGKGYALIGEAAAFDQAYRQAICDIKKKTTATIILSTLGCMNENLEFSLNKKRCAYNQVIRDVAIESGCCLVDAGACFDGYLRRCRTKDYFLEGFFNTIYFDKFQCSVMGCPDYLSKKRKLHLTIDGVHLNSRGANIFRDETERQIKAVINASATDHRARFSNLEVY